MSVSLVGAVGGAVTATGSTTGSYGQSPTGGNLLLAIVTWSDSSAKTFTPTESTGGWTELAAVGPIGNNPSGTSHAGVDFWTKTAAGGDTQPIFSQTSSGTAFMTAVIIFELAGANTTTPLDVSGIYQSGSTSIAFPTMTVTTTGNVAAAGEFGIAVFCQDNNTAGTQASWTELGSGWTLAYSDIANSQVGHTRANYQAAPSPGATLSDSGHFASGVTTYSAAAVLVVAAASAGTSPSAGLAATSGVPGTPVPGISLGMTIQGM